MMPSGEAIRQKEDRSRRCSWNGVVTVVGVLLAAYCFWQGLPAFSSLWRDDAQAHAPVQAPQRELVRTKIKDLRAGRRVLATALLPDQVVSRATPSLFL